MFLFFFGKEMCGVVSGKSLAYNTRTDSTPSCQGRSKSRYRNQPQKSQLLATHAMMIDCSKNRKCYEENTGNHLAPLSHSQRLLLERFHIVLMMPMVVMVDVFVIVMSAGSFSIYVH